MTNHKALHEGFAIMTFAIDVVNPRICTFWLQLSTPSLRYANPNPEKLHQSWMYAWNLMTATMKSYDIIDKLRFFEQLIEGYDIRE